MSWKKYTVETYEENKNMYHLYFLTIIATYTLESIVIPKYTSNLTDILNSNDFDKIKGIFFMIIGLWSFNQILYSVDHFMRAKLVPRFEESVINKVIKNIMSKYENDYQELDYSLIITKMNQFPKVMRSISTTFFKTVFPRTLVIIIICMYFTYLNTKLGIITSILIFIQLKYLKNSEFTCSATTIETQELFDKLLSVFSDKFQNLSSIYGSGTVSDEIENIQRVNMETTASKIKTYLCTAKSQSQGYIFNIIIFSIINYSNLSLFKKGSIDKKTFITVFLVSINLLNYLVDLSHTLPEFFYELEILRRYDDFFAFDVQEEGKIPFTYKTGHIQIRNLTYKYPGSNKVLFNDLTEDFNINQIIGIIGKSGSGKSTFIKLILGFMPIDRHKIFIDGQEINDINLNSYRKHIGYLNQNVTLFNKSVRENILYGFENNELEDIINKYGLNKVFQNLPNGLDTNAGLGGSNLSGGQKQVVLLLRSLLNPNKKIIIMDEPSAAVDADTKKIIYPLIKELSHNKTIIIITHDKNMETMFDKTIKLA